MNAVTTHTANGGYFPAFHHSQIIVKYNNLSSNCEVVLDTYLSEFDLNSSTRHTYKRSLSSFFSWIEETGRKLNNLDRADIVEYKQSLKKRSLSLNTINGYIVAVRQFYTWAEGRKLYPNIASGIRVKGRANKFEKEHLSDAKIAELLEYFRNKGNIRDYAMINLMLRTGLRTIEVARLQAKDITFKGDRRVLQIRGKGHEEKDSFVILSDKAYAPIKDYLKTRGRVKPEEALFSAKSRNKAYYSSMENESSTMAGILPDGLTTRAISGICKKGLSAIGLEGVNFSAHSLRHTTAVQILKNTNFEIAKAQEVLRHSSIDTTRIYLSSFKEEARLQEATELKLDNAF